MKKTMKHNAHTISPIKDVTVLFLFLAVAVFLSLFFRENLLVSSFLFFLPPTIWFSLKITERIPHILFFVFEFVCFFVFPIDYIATINQAWAINSTFPFRILGVVPIEDMVWGVLFALLSIVLYEYFFERERHDAVVGRSMTKQILFMGLIFVMFLILFASGMSFSVPYTYAVLTFTTSLVPLALFLVYYPRYLKSFWIMGIYFSILGIAHEYVGLALNHWSFPGEYIAWVNIGFATIPIEEFVFYFILAGPTALAYYKFADDRDT